MINSHNGYKNKPRIDVEKDYHVIKEWLDNFKEQIEKRYDKGETAYNLRNCAYIDEFEKGKIVYPCIMNGQPKFQYDLLGFYDLAPANIITGEKIVYLVSLLNSKFIFYCLSNFYMGGGIKGEFKSNNIEKIPVIYLENTIVFEKLSRLLIYMNINMFTNEQIKNLIERIIDFMVYGLYFENEMTTDGSYINNEVEKVLSKYDFSNFENLPDENKEKLVNEIYKELNVNKVILKALTFCNVEEIKIIEESVQTSDSGVEELEENED